MAERTMLFFHGSDALFSQFDMNFAVREGMADNGYLGVHLTSDFEIASRFGKYIYGVEVPMRIVELPLNEFRIMHDHASRAKCSRQFYQSRRVKLIEDGHSLIQIIELHGESKLFIAMDCAELRIIEIFTRSYSS